MRADYNIIYWLALKMAPVPAASRGHELLEDAELVQSESGLSWHNGDLDCV